MRVNIWRCPIEWNAIAYFVWWLCTSRALFYLYKSSVLNRKPSLLCTRVWISDRDFIDKVCHLYSLLTSFDFIAIQQMAYALRNVIELDMNRDCFLLLNRFLFRPSYVCVLYLHINICWLFVSRQFLMEQNRWVDVVIVSCIYVDAMDYHLLEEVECSADLFVFEDDLPHPRGEWFWIFRNFAVAEWIFRTFTSTVHMTRTL